MAEQQTTESLRATLFETLHKVLSGAIEPTHADRVVKLADKIIQTADLELRYAETLSKLDKDGQGINPGPMLLTNGKG